MQGNLGDCWFISAMALIASRDDLFNQITCEGIFKSYESKGLYVLKMYKNCKAHYVIVDDKLPCLEKSHGDYIPAFARNRNPNEFWVSIFEKAYAKLNVRYINLTSGFIDEALQDLSGLAPEMIRFTPSIDVDEFWASLKHLVFTNSLIGGSLNFLGRRDYPEDEKKELQREAKMCGIQYGHAYGVLDVREVEVDGVVNRLLRIKNPWGKENNMEWKGDWGDNDTRWTPEMKEKYNHAAEGISSKLDKEELVHKFGKNDNIFIMAIEDFIRYFNTLMAVRDFPDEWSGVRYFTKWSPSYGLPPRAPQWVKNPHFPFTLTTTTELAINLQQPDLRCFADSRPPMKKLVLMFLIFKNTEQTLKVYSSANTVAQSTAADSRSVTVEKELPPGDYIISIFTAAEGATSDCYLSIYFNCKKTEILFTDKSWEVILEEEEKTEEKKTSRPKGPARIRSLEKKKPEQIKEDHEEIEIESYDTKDHLEVVIKDNSSLELETELTVCNLLGVTYTDYKDYQGYSKEKQETIAENHKRVDYIADFNDYCLGVRGTFSLIDIIIKNKGLQVLGLRNNQINDQVVIEFCRKLKNHKELREIDVSKNPEITDKAGAALLYLAGRLTSICKIDISETAISLDLAHRILSRVNRDD